MPSNVSPLSISILANIVTVAGFWFALQGQKAEVEPQYVEILQQENTNLRSKIAEKDASNITLRLENSELRRLAGGDAEIVERSAIVTFLEDIDRPAWCKKVEYLEASTEDAPYGVRFTMDALNRAYEQRYGISAGFYVGKTDFATQDNPDTAMSYYENDYKALMQKRYVEFLEPARKHVEPRLFAKWHSQMPVSRAEYICGLEVGDRK